MTPLPTQDELSKVIEHALLKHANDFAEYLQGKMPEPSVTEAANEAKAAIVSWADKQQLDPFDFVEPCEPECSEVRHARHAGQWEMATRMEAALKQRIEKELSRFNPEQKGQKQ